MAKSLLILMLAAAQLVAGSGRSLYLCLSNDGSFCCIDDGPTGCVCCHDHDLLERVAPTDHHCHTFNAREARSDCNCDSLQPPAGERLVADQCGCTHVLLLVAAEQRMAVSRTRTTIDFERVVVPAENFAPWHVAADDRTVLRMFFPAGGSAAALDFTLTVLASTVIRC
jgi:hypothetical protein